MTTYIYSKSDAFKEHLKEVVGESIVFRTDLGTLKANDTGTILIHSASYTDLTIQDALRTHIASSCVFAVADDLPDIGKMLRYTHLGIKGYCNAYMVRQHYEQLFSMLNAGQSWYPPELLSQALSLAHSSVRPEEIDDQLNELTLRQKEIALSIAEGKSNKIVAEDCGIAEQTVKSHLTQIYTKLNVADRLGLVIYIKSLNVLGSNKRSTK